MKKYTKRIISLFVCLLLLFNILSVNIFCVFGEENKKANTFIDFYQNSGTVELEAKQLTNQEYYTLNVFMSNWYKPGVTTLKDLINAEGEFFNTFATSLSITDTDYLAGIVKAFGLDVLNGINTGKCTIVGSDGKSLTGAQFLSKMINTVPEKVVDRNDTTVTSLSDKDSVVYFENNSHIAFDFSVPAVKAAFQTVLAYNPNLFLMKEGIQNVKYLFVDAVGNLWGVTNEGASEFSNGSGAGNVYIDSVDKASNVFLILPACLNPATFTPNAKEQKDLRMPLMNRFVLSTMVLPDWFTDSKIFENEFIPIYNLLSYGSGQMENSALNVIGVNTISPYTFNTSRTDEQGFWTEDDRKIDYGNFMYNPNSFTVNIKESKNGIPNFATNSYIVFSMNMGAIDTLNNNKPSNGFIDFHTGGAKNDRYSFSTITGVWDNDWGEDEKNEKNNKKQFNFAIGEKADAEGSDDAYETLQRRYLFYLFSPTALNLNQVSMNFYDTSSINVNSEDLLSNALKDYLVTTEDGSGPIDVSDSSLTSSDITKLGLTGMNLYLEDVQIKYRRDDGSEAVLVTPENYKNSKLVKLLIDGEGSISDEMQKAGNYSSEVYNSIVKDGNTTGVVFRDYLFFGVEESKFISDLDSDFKSSFGDSYTLKNGNKEDSRTTGMNFNEVTTATESGRIVTRTATNHYYILPEMNAILNYGSGNDDNAVGRLLGIGDREILNKIGEQDNNIKDERKNVSLSLSSVSGQVDNSTGKVDYSFDKSETNEILNMISAIYGYSLFFPANGFGDSVIGGTMTGSNDITTFGKTKTYYGNDTEINLPNLTVQIPIKEFNSNIMMGVYLSYIVDMMGLGTCDAVVGVSFGSFSSLFLPKYNITSSGGNLTLEDMVDGLSGVTSSEDMSFENMQKDLIRRIYGLTNDSDNSYRNNLIKNIIEGFILTVHRTITGTWGNSISSVSTGDSSTYQSVTGYIYTPTLEELSFTASLMNNYIQVYIFSMFLIIFLLILMVLLHLRTWQQGVITVVIMSVALLFPYVLISNTINISNKISDSIYSDRFDFWAMSEHFQSVVSLQGSEFMETKEKWLAEGNATADITKFGGSGVKIKWMSPKKVDMFQNLYSDASLSQSFVTNMEIFKWLFASTIYDSEYVDTDVYGSFVYRRYNNIALEAQSYYEWGKTLEKHIDKPLVNSDYEYSGINGVKRNLKTPNALVELYESAFTPNVELFSAGFSRFDEINNKIFYTDGLSGVNYTEEKYNDINTVSQFKGTSGDVVYNQGNVIGIWGMFSKDVNLCLEEVVKGNDYTSNKYNPGIVSNLPDESSANTEFKESEKDTAQLISKAIYLKNTESPYYYFYSVLKKRYGTATGVSTDTDFKRSLLEDSVFRVDSGVTLTASNKNIIGKYRDFLDMEGLFTFVIPYLKLGNDYVSGWQEVNGTEIEEYNFDYELYEEGSNAGDVNLDTLEEIQADGTLGGPSAEYTEAVQRKNAMNRVWNMYSPWVDSLYDLDVLNEKLYLKTSTLTVSDSLNPSSYLNAKNRKGEIIGRPMIFSEADMTVKGYTYRDLTDVEKRIQAVTEQTYKDLLYLINYYDMDDEVLISAAAMYATFNFNKEFSENRFLGESVMLYPQGFELRNFNYDAFMRLALLNSTGETVFATEDLYTRILSKTSLFTGILLLVCDLIACIAIPMIKFVILLALLFLGILICITCVVNPPDKIFESVNKSLLFPTVLFMSLNIGFAFLMSIVVGEGLTAYVGSKSVSLSTNDPSITMLIMAIIGIIYLFFAWKILKLIVDSYKKFGMSSVMATVGIVGSAFAHGTKGIAKKGLKMAGKVGGGGLGAAVGAITAGKGNRLSGAFEGASRGAKNVINQRISDKRRRKDMMESQKAGNEDLANRLNSLSKETGSGGSGGGSGGSSTNEQQEPNTNNNFERYDSSQDSKLGKAVAGGMHLYYKARDKFDKIAYKKDMHRESLREKRLDKQERKIGRKEIIADKKAKGEYGLKYSFTSAREHYQTQRNNRQADRTGDILDKGISNNQRKRSLDTRKEVLKNRTVDDSF